MGSPRQLSRRIDPLLAFAVIALLGFGVARWMVPSTNNTTALDSASLATELERLETTLGRPATANERAETTKQWRQREILYREAIRLGMGEHDPVVKTQLVRAMTHLLRSTAPHRTPTDEELETFLQEHRDRYGNPARWSFDLVRGAAERGSLSEADAKDLLASVEIDGLDAVPLEQLDARHHRPHRALVSEFGEEFAREVEDATPQKWTLVSTTDGRVLVRVSRVTKAVAPILDGVRAKVTEDWQRAVEAAHVQARLEKLSSKYPLEPSMDAEVDSQ